MEQDQKWEEEKQFHVKDIPIDFDEWKLFHVFHKFGLVSNVRIIGDSKQRSNQYGFVSMVSYDGADAVRNALVSGVLKTADVQLKVENMRSAQERQRTTHQQSGFGRSYQKRPYVPPPEPVKPAVKLEKKIPPGVVPSSGAVTAIYVEQPSTMPTNRFVFYIKVKDSDKDPIFLHMLDEMKTWVSLAPKTPITSGQCMIVRYKGELYRAYITESANPECGDGATRAYLMDEGREVQVTEAWPMKAEIAGVAARVCECDLAGLHLKPGVTVERYEAMRSLLKVVSQRAKLTVSLVRFVRGINMVNARSIYTHPSGAVEDSDIVTGFVAKSKDFILVAAETSKLEYERDAIMTMREKCKAVEMELAEQLKTIQLTR